MRAATLPSNLDQLIDHITAVCPLPSSVQRVVALTSDPEANGREVVEAVACDPGLAAEVMRLSNSTAFGASRKIATLPQAIVTIGFRELNKVAGAMGLLAAFRSKQELSLSLHDYGLVAGTLATRLSRELRAGDAGSMFLCGLLSEVGAMACLAVDPAGYVALWDRAFSGWDCRSIDPWGIREQLETARYGATTCVIGMRLLRRNLLPELVVEAVDVSLTKDPVTFSPAQRITAVSKIASVFFGRAAKAKDPLTVDETIALCADRFLLQSIPIERLSAACTEALEDASRMLRTSR